GPGRERARLQHSGLNDRSHAVPGGDPDRGARRVVLFDRLDPEVSEWDVLGTDDGSRNGELLAAAGEGKHRSLTVDLNLNATVARANARDRNGVYSRTVYESGAAAASTRLTEPDAALTATTAEQPSTAAART